MSNQWDEAELTQVDSVNLVLSKFGMPTVSYDQFKASYFDKSSVEVPFHSEACNEALRKVCAVVDIPGHANLRQIWITPQPAKWHFLAWTDVSFKISFFVLALAGAAWSCAQLGLIVK